MRRKIELSEWYRVGREKDFTLAASIGGGRDLNEKTRGGGPTRFKKSQMG